MPDILIQSLIPTCTLAITALGIWGPTSKKWRALATVPLMVAVVLLTIIQGRRTSKYTEPFLDFHAVPVEGKQELIPGRSVYMDVNVIPRRNRVLGLQLASAVGFFPGDPSTDEVDRWKTFIKKVEATTQEAPADVPMDEPFAETASLKVTPVSFNGFYNGAAYVFVYSAAEWMSPSGGEKRSSMCFYTRPKVEAGATIVDKRLSGNLAITTKSFICRGTDEARHGRFLPAFFVDPSRMGQLSSSIRGGQSHPRRTHPVPYLGVPATLSVPCGRV